MDGEYDGRDVGHDYDGDGDGDGGHDGRDVGAGSDGDGGGDQDHDHDCGVDRQGLSTKAILHSYIDVYRFDDNIRYLLVYLFVKE